MIYKLWHIWFGRQLSVHVAALALYLLLALVPFVTLLTGLAGSLLGRPDVQLSVVEYLDRLGQPDLSNAIQGLLDGVTGFERGDVFIILFSLTILLYGANGAFLQLRSAINTIQNTLDPSLVKVKLTWLQSAEDFFVGYVAIFVTLFAILIATVLAPIISGVFQPILSLLLTALVLVPLYKIIGRRGISWKASFVGGLVVAVGNLLAGILLSVYFDFTSPRSVFSLASTITALVTWLMILSTILILGGLIANYLHFSWRKNTIEA